MSPGRGPHLLQLHFLGVELLLLPLQLLLLFLEVCSFLVQVLLLADQVLLKLPHLLVRVGLVLLQRLTREHRGTFIRIVGAAPSPQNPHAAVAVRLRGLRIVKDRMFLTARR